MAILIQQSRVTTVEPISNKSFVVIATFRTENGKRKLIDLHFPTETIRAVMAFIKRR